MIIAATINHIWILDGKQMKNDNYLLRGKKRYEDMAG